ncbi:MAG TPA: tetratricopeptide repeat protein, partial [Terriglobales bacterium]|nr:tetratricopeptide repeat protein [Terriglobales bacterium]
FVASAIPLTEVYNNLGVVASRRQNPAQARQYFERALQADPNNPDYHFNLAVTLARAGDTAGAVRELRADLALHPEDREAQSLLEVTSAAGRAAPAPAAKLPLERIQLTYDETSYRQLALEIENVSEMRLAQLDDRSHARAHVERGRQMFQQGYLPEAEKQFREAIRLAPTSAAAHGGLAQVLEGAKDYAAARSEAQASLRLEPSLEAYLVLARLDLRDNKLEDAARSVEQALALAPADAAALALQRDIAAKRAQKAPPLQRP